MTEDLNYPIDIEEPAEYHDVDEPHDFTTNKYASVQVDLVKELIKVGITKEQIKTSDVFEQLILTYARSGNDCVDIPVVIPEDCSFIWKVMPLSNFVIINYKTLSEENLSKIAKFYREKYSMESYTLSEFEDMLHDRFGCYLTGHIRHDFKMTNAICLDLTPLCAAFPDMSPILNSSTDIQQQSSEI